MQQPPGQLQVTVLSQIAQAPLKQTQPTQILTMKLWTAQAPQFWTNAVLDLTDCPTQTISLHRAVLKDSMIEAFKNPEILRVNLAVTFISNSGKEEEGKGAGVFRDALSTFWNQFFNSLSVGGQEKVPALRHDYQRGEWEAIARILVYGYMKEKYFPLSLS